MLPQGGANVVLNQPLVTYSGVAFFVAECVHRSYRQQKQSGFDSDYICGLWDLVSLPQHHTAHIHCF